MHAYRVFKYPEKGYKAVKDGFSWPGFFFTSIWGLSRQLWLVSVALVLVSLAVSGLFIELAAKNPFLPLGVNLIFGLVVGLNGNAWRTRNLHDRGYTLVGRINARSPEDAASKVAASGGVIPAELKAGFHSAGFLAIPESFQRVFSIVELTWKAAFRYRLFWVLTALLLAAVVGLPILIKDDGTAEGFAQILITYTLGAVTGLLGLCTLWLACGTLARDIEECQIQMVAVKPIARWQIWLGKWLGIVSLNAVLLGLAGLSIYGLLEWRARRLPADELAKLQNEVLVARASVKEQSLDNFIEQTTEHEFKTRLEKNKLQDANPEVVRQQIREQVKAEIQVVPPGAVRPWVIRLGAAKDRLKDQPLYLRVKFNTAQPSGSSATFYAAWQVGTPKKTPIWQDTMSLSSDTFHEFQIDPEFVR